jgi:hypothetical protein
MSQIKQYLVEAFGAPHDGRTRRHYVMASSPTEAVRQFQEMFPQRVVRNLWELVPITAYADQVVAGAVPELRSRSQPQPGDQLSAFGHEIEGTQ